MQDWYGHPNLFAKALALRRAQKGGSVDHRCDHGLHPFCLVHRRICIQGDMPVNLCQMIQHDRRLRPEPDRPDAKVRKDRLRLKAVSWRQCSLFALRTKGDHLNAIAQSDAFENPLKIHAIRLHKIHRGAMWQPPLNHMGQQKSLSGQLRALDIAVVEVELQQPKRNRSRQQYHEQMGQGQPTGHRRSQNPHKPSVLAI